METLNETAFDGVRLRRPGTWAIAFLADWCGFCDRFRPTFEALGAERGFESAIADVSDDASPLWDRFHIEVVPTVLVFREGEVIARADGRFARGLNAADVDRLRSVLRTGASAPPDANV